MPEKPIRPQVVVRHGREPGEDGQFARGLADLLRRVGFEVRLEDGPDSSESARAGAEATGHALLIVTRAWLEGAASRAEIGRSAGQTAVNHRQLAVLREPIDDRLIAAHLRDLPVVEWRPDDPEPDARFWEVYCGLTGTPPGDRPGWAASGRDLLATPKTEATDRVRCPSRPAMARPSPAGTFLLTDSGACFLVDPGPPLRVRPLPDLDGCSAVAVDGSGRIFVGLYNGMVATLRDDDWDYHPAEAAVLSLAATARGLAVGDATGSVRFADPPAPAIASAELGEPVVELIPFDQGVVALGARGGLWRLGLPEAGRVPVAPVASNEALGRPVGLFDSGDPSKVGVFSAGRVALLSGGVRTFRVGVRRFPEGIGAVVAFGPRPGEGAPPLGLLTDSGQVWTISADLGKVAPVVLPDAPGPVVGLAPGVGGGLLAWTSGGTALAIGRDGSTRSLATGDAALAFADPGRPDRASVVHWHPDRGVQVRRLRPDPSR